MERKKLINIDPLSYPLVFHKKLLENQSPLAKWNGVVVSEKGKSSHFENKLVSLYLDMGEDVYNVEGLNLVSKAG